MILCLLRSAAKELLALTNARCVLMERCPMDNYLFESIHLTVLSVLPTSVFDEATLSLVTAVTLRVVRTRVKFEFESM